MGAPSPRPDEGGARVDLGSGSDAALHRFSHEAMATVFEVRAAHADAAYAGQAAHAAFALVDRLEQQLSRFVSNSDVARASGLAAGQSTAVGPAAMECLVIARHIYRLTDGAFDASIGTGFETLELLPDELRVHARADGVRLDLGGIGKGYAVDQMAAVLEEWDVERALVHGGWSSVLALEPPSDRDAWPLTLSAPGPGPARVLASLSARQRALSASGTRKQDHIRDPRTGQPVPHGAVWVALPRTREAGHSPAAVADALSTACMLLPRERIEELCRRNAGLEVFRLVERDGHAALDRLGSR